jgi:hypothetical protein
MTPLLLSTRTLDLIDLMVSWALLQYARVYFYKQLTGVAFLTGVTWLVVVLDVIFVMMGK